VVVSSNIELSKVDVLVVGGGPAGIGAALAGARTGAKTMLIENHGFFGGVGSFCLGMNINQMRPGGPRSAVHELLIAKLLVHGDLAVQLRGHSLRCNVEYFKVAILDALDEVGCEYLVHTRAVDAVMDGNRIIGVVVATKKGLAVIRAKAVVDCTGDADIAHFAGAETLFDKENSPMTLALNVTNFDIEKGGDFKGALRKARKGPYPLAPRNCLTQGFPSSNAIMINHNGTRDLGPFDATDPHQLTQAECLSRRQAIQMTAAWREFGGDNLKDLELIAAGPQIGVRESRRIRGGYILTEEDAVKGTRFDDVIAWRSGAIDVGGGVYDAKMKVHGVPYRCILPEKIDGLLAAGRCLSTTHIAHSAGKSMGNCMATGHAAGLAATLAAKNGIVPRQVDVNELQDALRADGVDLNRGRQSS
jgi:succinate dehydrogenase/fumarate reductase flavoprotein subunit